MMEEGRGGRKRVKEWEGGRGTGKGYMWGCLVPR